MNTKLQDSKSILRKEEKHNYPVLKIYRAALLKFCMRKLPAVSKTLLLPENNRRNMGCISWAQQNTDIITIHTYMTQILLSFYILNIFAVNELVTFVEDDNKAVLLFTERIAASIHSA